MSSLIKLRRQPRADVTPKASLRVLLISPSYAPTRNTMYFPIGLSYVAAYIRKFGYEVVPLNMNHWDAEERYQELDRILREEKIDIVGITGITIAFNEIERIIQFTRPRSKAQIVLGGGITSCESELVLTTLKPDYMVVSEGELIFHELLKVIETGGDPGDVRGIWYFKDGKPCSTGEGDGIGNLDDLPLPDLDLFGMEEHLAIQSEQQFSYHESHLQGHKMLPITASRSCPFRCTFCYHAGMGKYRRHSIAATVDHIKASIAKFNVRYFMIYDELFSANKARLIEFCELVKDLNIKWYCQLRVDQMDQALLHRMKAAGCHYISYGFESGSDTVLESMQKKITAAQIARAVQMTREARIGIQANFLFGDLVETEQTLQETLDFQQENQLFFVDWSAVIPYPGTQLFDRAVARNQIPDRELFIRSMGNVSQYLWKHMINLTDLTDARFRELYVELRELNDQNHRKVRTIVTDGHAIDGTHSSLSFRCPTCDHVETDAVIPYPPECANGGAPNIRGPIGIAGMNIVCPECMRKHHLVANTIPHVAQVYAEFQRSLDALKASQTPVVVLPAVDRFYGVLSEDVDLQGLNVAAVLDTRQHRIGDTFLGQTTTRLDDASATEQLGRIAVVLPWIEYETALTTLIAAGFRREDIVCWNEYFARSMLGADADKPQNPITEPRVGFGAPLPETFAPSKAWPRTETNPAALARTS
ncbi:MAG TPA: radical SAM protein [Polyangiaceae bacterium]|nr:radical SAM protein [Polyangiaceae bacterium]